MTVTVKIINKTAALQIILLAGGQQLPIPPTDQGETNTFDPDAEDDVMQMERLHKALSLPSVRQQIARGELVVEGFDDLRAGHANDDDGGGAGGAGDEGGAEVARASAGSTARRRQGQARGQVAPNHGRHR